MSIYQFLMGIDDQAVFREHMGTNGTNNKTVDHTTVWSIKANTQLWKKVVELQLCDVDDIDHHVSSLRNVLPYLPSCDEDQVHVKPPYADSPMSHQEHHLIHLYPDTFDHLLSYADDRTKTDPGDLTLEA